MILQKCLISHSEYIHIFLQPNIQHRLGTFVVKKPKDSEDPADSEEQQKALPAQVNTSLTLILTLIICVLIRLSHTC